MLLLFIITLFNMDDFSSLLKDGLETAKGKIKEGMEAAKEATGDLLNKGLEMAVDVMRFAAEQEANNVRPVLINNINNINQGISESGIILTQERKTNHFEGIHIDSTVNVNIDKGIQESILVQADQNYMKFVETTVDSNILYITINVPELKLRMNAININVTMCNLSYIKVSDYSSVKVKEAFQSENLKVRVTRNSNLLMQVDSKNLDAKVSTASIASFYGKSESATFHVTGTAALCASILDVNNVDIIMNQASIARIIANKVLKYKLIYFSSLRYVGQPNVLESYSDENSVVENSKYGF